VHEPHVPVLAEAVVQYAVPAPGPLVVVDCTIGAGGHAAALLRAMGPAGRLLGIDRDPDALELAAERLAPFGDQVRLVHGNFAELGALVSDAGFERADAVVFDFGLSSMFVDRPDRGFSYQHDAPLDMRMDPTQPLSAYDVVNTYDEAHLARIIRSYGEERWASRIAQFIVAARKRRPITTTGELVEVIRAAVPSAARRVGPHPARRTFQALRLEVNKELEAIESSLPQATTHLNPGGRLVALSYHSGEDRLVKRFIRDEASGETPRLRMLTRKPVRPSEDEIRANPRASAAKLRAAERLAAPPEPDGPPGGDVA
jgi:16S rRNA (cytosine1402-N4)-methyltransferase